MNAASKVDNQAMVRPVNPVDYDGFYACFRKACISFVKARFRDRGTAYTTLQEAGFSNISHVTEQRLADLLARLAAPTQIIPEDLKQLTEQAWLAYHRLECSRYRWWYRFCARQAGLVSTSPV